MSSVCWRPTTGSEKVLVAANSTGVISVLTLEASNETEQDLL